MAAPSWDCVLTATVQFQGFDVESAEEGADTPSRGCARKHRRVKEMRCAVPARTPFTVLQEFLDATAAGGRAITFEVPGLTSGPDWSAILGCSDRTVPLRSVTAMPTAHCVSCVLAFATAGGWPHLWVTAMAPRFPRMTFHLFAHAPDGSWLSMTAPAGAPDPPPMFPLRLGELEMAFAASSGSPATPAVLVGGVLVPAPPIQHTPRTPPFPPTEEHTVPTHEPQARLHLGPTPCGSLTVPSLFDRLPSVASC